MKLEIAVKSDPLPNGTQLKRLGELIQQAFIDLRYIEGQQAHDLAYAFHNLPAEMFGWGSWSIEGTRKRLEFYQSKYSELNIYDYSSAFAAIFYVDFGNK